MTYPVDIIRYDTQRKRRSQNQVLQTIGGNALRIDTTAVAGEQITLSHLLTWDQWVELYEYYRNNIESTFNLTIDGDTISCRFLEPPVLGAKNGSYYDVKATVGRVL